MIGGLIPLSEKMIKLINQVDNWSLDDLKVFALIDKGGINANPSILCYLIREGYKLSTIKVAIETGADVNAKDDKGYAPLHWAGYKALIDMLVNYKADINIKDNNGWTPLHWAAHSGKQEIAEVLIAHNANVNVRNNSGDKPIDLAKLHENKAIEQLLKDHGSGEPTILLFDEVKKSNIAEVRFLIEKDGADVNAKDSQEYSPIHWAKSGEMVDLLVNSGADVNVQDKNKWTTLHWAVYNDKKDIIETLLNHDKTNVNVKDKDGWTPLHWAKDIRTVALLIEKGADVNAEDNNGYIPLYFAVRDGKKDIIEILLNHDKTNVNIKDNDGRTPLHWAKDVGAAALLVEKGADVNAQDNNDRTPLHLAAIEGYPATVELLLKHNANTNIQDNREMTPLHLARNAGIAALLIEKGANVNAKDNYGYTPLHWAAQNDKKEVAEVLIAHNANVNARNNSSDKPIDLAKMHEHKAVEQLLKDHGGEPTALLFDEVKKSNNEEVRLLIEKDGADVNARDKAGLTPLHWAAIRESLEMAKLLIEKGADANDNKKGYAPIHWVKTVEMLDLLVENGADVNTKDYTGSTRLHSAAKNGYTAIVEPLIGKGADINVQNKQEQTPLHLAKDVGTAALFIEKGANINAKDKDGNTLLHLAAKNGYTAIVELLIGKGVDITANNSNKIPLELAANEDISGKLKNYEKSKFFEKDLVDTQNKLKKVLSEKNELLEKESKVQKELRDLKGEQPVLEKVLLEMKEEFSKCNLAQSLDKAVQGLDDIQKTLFPYEYYSSSKRGSFEDVINTILSDTKLLDDSSIKSKTLNAVDEMLNMLKTCGAQSEDKLYTIADQIREVKEKAVGTAEIFYMIPDVEQQYVM